MPTELNFRANIFAFKKLGVERIISISAVGSLKEEIRPMDFVIPDQFIDRTRLRPSTFFGNGIVAHVSFADPFCEELRRLIYDTGEELGYPMHPEGTYVCIEGPQFSTRAESRLYRRWGGTIVGMTNLQEAKLAREAEICYVTIALVTDYDVWHVVESDVNVEMVVENLQRNVDKVKLLIKEAIPKIEKNRTCSCQFALKDAIITDKNFISQETRRQLEPIIGKYFIK
jgi:5'-methylthioadenosine phosphorylase